MKHFTPPPMEPRLALFRAMYKFASRYAAHLPPGRERSDAILRELCGIASRYVVDPVVLAHLNRPDRYSEHMTVRALAAIDPNELIEACRERFPDDEYPADRLNPFLHPQDAWP